MALALSYRAKITLAFSLLALLGVTVLSALFLYTGYQEFRSTRIATSERMSSCLASNIARDVQRDGLFRVFETLEKFTSGWEPRDRPETVVLDQDYRIYATTVRPAREYLSLPIDRLGDEFAGLVPLTQHYDQPVTLPSARGYVIVTPMRHEGVRLGTVMVDFPLASLREQSWHLMRLILGYSVLLLSFLWLIGWLLGRRMVRPLLTLTENMRRVGEGDLSVGCAVDDSRDEFASNRWGDMRICGRVGSGEVTWSTYLHRDLGRRRGPCTTGNDGDGAGTGDPNDFETTESFANGYSCL